MHHNMSDPVSLLRGKISRLLPHPVKIRMTQTQFAALAGVGGPTLSRFLRGKTVSVGVYFKLQAAYERLMKKVQP
jgi:hypothetical protein